MLQPMYSCCLIFNLFRLCFEDAAAIPPPMSLGKEQKEKPEEKENNGEREGASSQLYPLK